MGEHVSDSTEHIGPMPHEKMPLIEGLSKDERNLAMFCHLLGLAILIIPMIGGILGPLVLWLMKREDHPFVNDQGKQALNFQISILIYAAICVPLIFLLIGVPMMFAVMIFNIIFVIRAAVMASNGRQYRYPLSFHFIK